MKCRLDTDWADASCRPLALRTVTIEVKIQFLRDALHRVQYLRAGRPAGHGFWGVVPELDAESQPGQIVAALWQGGAVLHLKDGDDWPGRSA